MGLVLIFQKLIPGTGWAICNKAQSHLTVSSLVKVRKTKEPKFHLLSRLAVDFSHIYVDAKFIQLRNFV